MALGDLGQDRVRDHLQQLLDRGRARGSFLFEGPPGTGKEAFAVELGRVLNCERQPTCAPRGLFRNPPAAETEHLAPEEACSSCRRFMALQHPDLHLVFPLPTGTWEKDPQEVRQQLEAKARDPWYQPVFDRPAGIQADVIREGVLPAVSRVPAEARVKVVVVSEADRMAFGVGNLLLKTLEEPPEDCLLVLTSAVPERLLPTMLSRCQRVAFAPLAEAWMLPRLALVHEAPPERLQFAARIAQGSMRTAARFVAGELEDLRQRAFDVMRAASDCDLLELIERAGLTSREASKQRQVLPLFLHLLVLVARDVLLAVEGAAGAALPYVNTDRTAEIETLAQGFASPALRRIIRQTEEAERQVARYVHAELTLDALFIELARQSERGRAMSARA